MPTDLSSLYVDIGDAEVWYSVEIDTSMSGVGGWTQYGEVGYGHLRDAEADFAKAKTTTMNRVRIVLHSKIIIRMESGSAL